MLKTEDTVGTAPAVAVRSFLLMVRSVKGRAGSAANGLAPVPLTVTVPLFMCECHRLAQFPVTLNVPEEPGAVSEPLLNATAVALSVPLDPVNVPHSPSKLPALTSPAQDANLPLWTPLTLPSTSAWLSRPDGASVHGGQTRHR